MSFNYTTGPTLLPDVGVLAYNGCTFSSHFETSVSGTAVEDDARRTVKFMEYTITVDGYVTAPTGTTIKGAMTTLQLLLTEQGGNLIYTGRAMDLVVNPVGQAGLRDVAWGPVPKLLDFQPLGGGLSAKVRWQVTTRITPLTPSTGTQNLLRGPLLQFNYETSVVYGEDGYSTLSIRGILEIPITRRVQSSRAVTTTADDYRQDIEGRIMSGIDLSRFRVVHREFNVSRDKRTMEWSFQAEELPYMDMPAWCTNARGGYSARPARAGMGLCLWLCTLRASYTVRADIPRRTAWWAFLALVRQRMAKSVLANVPGLTTNQNPIVTIAQSVANRVAPAIIGRAASDAATVSQFFTALFRLQNTSVAKSRKAFLVDFSVDEGVYLDSKTVSFSASWRLTTTFSHIILASGIWAKVPEVDAQGNNLWATSIRDVSGQRSWLPNKLNPALDIIVDFGT